MKRIIDRGREFGGLYNLDTEVPKSLLVLELLPHLNGIVTWVILLSLC